MCDNVGMRLLHDLSAPSPRRVRIYIAEKGAVLAQQIELVEVQLRAGAHFEPEYLRHNPEAVVPCLVLDDGRAIGESVAICRYLEALVPSPPLFGADPFEQGQVAAWTRRVEQQGYHSVQHFYRNGHPAFEGRALPGVRGGVPQIPALSERAAQTFMRAMARVDAQLAHGGFVVGPNFTFADIMLLTTVDFARRTKLPGAQELEGLAHLQRWHAQVSARPSAEA